MTKKFNSGIFPGSQGGPLMHVIAAKAVAFFEALQPEFKNYQKQIVKNSQAMAQEFLKQGINMVSNGTENHLLLLDLTAKGLTGKLVANVLDELKITVNKNSVPNDPKSPFVTSGIRIGTPAITTRGFLEADAIKVAELISMVINALEKNKDANGNSQIDSELEKTILAEVKALTAKYPLYTQANYAKV